MKLPISIERGSLRWHTCLLIDLPATLGFASHFYLSQNSLVGKCVCGPKIVVHNAMDNDARNAFF